MNPSSGPASDLRGWYVISPRPVGGHAGLRRAAAARGAQLLALSPIRLVGLPDAGAALSEALAAPVVVFTSPAAVRFAARVQPLRKPPASYWCAVGAGTAAALGRAGVDGALFPHRRMDTEGLRALEPLHSISGRAVGLITAPGGRGLMAEQLRQRGARVKRADVYRREAIRIAARHLLALDTVTPRTAICISSAEALDALWQQLSPPRRARLRNAVAIVSSARLAKLARHKGFQTLCQADSAQPKAMIQALAEAAAGPLFR
ncbi:MAG: uroporphyrinogen-III synthase [Gammaproteobacteria bacterium HGW-Gammaproteobacteria-7]|nr:MAG: uroporphyrinogen-III synthase [Gammaproteobacteria bacterium HGW-Gammaproteobacteria-7]